MTRTLGRFALALVIAATALVMAAPSPASADFGCPGDRDSWRQYRNSAGTVAAVRIRVCHFKFPAQEWACATDEGMFREYAGPIYRPNNCVRVRSTMKDPFNGDTIMDHITYIGACN